VLADDNADMRDYLRRLLSGRYVVEAVDSGTQALAAIRRDRPDLVLSDIMMPELDGYGLLRALRGDPATVTLPVILLSARAGEEATAEGLEAGADDYLVKPFSARELLARVEARLEIARTRAEAQRRTQEALTALLETARWIVSAQEVDAVPDVARTLATLAQRIVGSEIVSLLAVDEAGMFTPLAAVGRTPGDDAAWHATVARYGALDYFSPERLQRLLVGEVVDVDVADRAAHGLPVYGMGTAVSAPLHSDGRLRGILSFAYADPGHQFSSAELELASAFAQMALLALERERLLRERTDARAEALALAEATQRMDEFLGIASHELRTPVTSLVAMMQLAARSLGNIATTAATLPDEQVSRLHRAQELLEHAVRQTVRLNRLVGDLIDVTRIKAGKLEMRAEPCDLMALVREVVQEQQSVWPTRHIALEAPRRKKFALVGDADRICQVILNLLSNALKYSSEDRPVVIRVEVSDNMARIEVRDEGPGLTVEQQTRVWERFYRVPGIEQRSGSIMGLGLGLHICQTIVEQHGGQIGVDSAVGKGSTFWFTLPLPQER
ncbi:MAG TPA: ATP-binding protein, partial [Ktedonobacterales bacterium]|nr:ATP-binding protein [Ktedonobacterales bacterium]